MKIANYLKAEPKWVTHCHNGTGTVKDTVLFQENDFHTKLRFFRHMVLPPESSIGFHKHGDNEELYIILKGKGIIRVNEEKKQVTEGDVIVNQPFDGHSLTNDSTENMEIMVFEVSN